MGLTVTSSIAGVALTPLREIADERGSVLHLLRADAPEFDGFGECYLSEVKPGFVKAWKRHRSQIQNLAVPAGRARFALYDDRVGSTTQGTLMVLELGRPDSYARLRIPPMVWYGFAALGPERALLVNCANLPHVPLESESASLEQFEAVYHWPPLRE